MPATSNATFDFEHYLHSILQNDEAVLAAVYKENYPSTEKYILQNSGTKDDAKDIFQEAFIVLWRNIQLKKFVPENKQSIGAYLFSVSKNKWISYLRSAQHKHFKNLEHETADEQSVSDSEEDVYINEVAGNMEKLGDNCKELLIAFYYKKNTMLKIAEHFGWTEATAKNNKYRCLEKLRNLVKNQNNKK